jgi:60 kDa SS-A/Ro ribonucleoprotein
VPNSAGGYAFAVDDWTRLERFLVLGSEGGSYYATERALTLENAKAVLRCVAADGARTVTQIVALSDEGRAPKNDPAIFALALAASRGDDATRRAALAALPRVCRTGTHLFHFAEYVDGMRGWGRGLRDAVARWYQGQSVEKLAYQAVKYQQRDGWSHRDLLRLSHPKPQTEQHKTLYHWITQGWPGVGDEPHPDAGTAPRLGDRAGQARRVGGGDRRSDPRLQPAARGHPDGVAERPAVWRALLDVGCR